MVVVTAQPVSISDSAQFALSGFEKNIKIVVSVMFKESEIAVRFV